MFSCLAVVLIKTLNFLLLQLSTLTDVPKSSADQIQKMQEQNNNLRDVISQMRNEMQQLGDQLPQKIKSPSQPNPVANGK